MTNKYTVAIIGCGSIGALKADAYDSPGGDAVLTHAHAFHAHPRTELRAFVDADMEKARDARHKWAKDTAYVYEDLMRERMYNGQLDIIVIATPTTTHRDTLMQALALEPRLVIAEKPFCSSLKEAEEVYGAYTAAGIPILVNYTRRFDPVAAKVYADLRDGAYGQIYHARCVYGRGLRRDGCHAIDIFNHVLGYCGGLYFDHAAVDDNVEPGDGTYNVHLEYNACRNVEMVGVDSRAWGAFEMEFVCEKGVVSFPEWGKRVAIRRPHDEETFGQYKALGWPAELDATALEKALLYVADNAVRFLGGAEMLKCTAADAIRVHKILENIKGR